MFRYNLLFGSLLSFSMLVPIATVPAGQPAAERATPTAAGRPAQIVVNVPLDSIVWVDGRRTNSTGLTRRFLTPPLAPGQRYGYDLRVTWVEGGRSREVARHVSFRPGDRITLNLSRPNWTQTAPDLYMDPAAPAPWRTDYYQDPLNYPNYPNFLFPGVMWRPR